MGLSLASSAAIVLSGAVTLAKVEPTPEPLNLDIPVTLTPYVDPTIASLAELLKSSGFTLDLAPENVPARAISFPQVVDYLSHHDAEAWGAESRTPASPGEKGGGNRTEQVAEEIRRGIIAFFRELIGRDESRG